MKPQTIFMFVVIIVVFVGGVTYNFVNLQVPEAASGTAVMEHLQAVEMERIATEPAYYAQTLEYRLAGLQRAIDRLGDNSYQVSPSQLLDEHWLNTQINVGRDIRDAAQHVQALAGPSEVAEIDLKIKTGMEYCIDVADQYEGAARLILSGSRYTQAKRKLRYATEQIYPCYDTIYVAHAWIAKQNFQYSTQ